MDPVIGITIAAKKPIMAVTVSSSTRVNPLFRSRPKTAGVGLQLTFMAGRGVRGMQKRYFFTQSSQLELALRTKFILTI
jgi:hypothetical protein